MSSPFEDAAKYAYFWEGSELVAYEPVAVPLWVTTLEVVVQKRKPVPPIEEFVLRSIDGGLTTLDAVSGLLGLEPSLAEEAVLNQLQVGHLMSEVTAAGDRALMITSRGQTALRELVSFAPERQETFVIFDRVVRVVSGADDRGLLRPRDLPFRSLRARPPVSSPRLADISIDEVADVLARAGGERKAKRKAGAEYQLLGVKRVVRSERRYKPATLLIYRGSKKGRFDAGVVIDGRPSRLHTAAMSELGGLKYLEVDDAILASGRSLREASEKVPLRLRNEIWMSPDLDQALREFAQARRRLRDPDVTADDPAADMKGASPRELARIQYIEAGTRLESAPARRVPAWEHLPLLEWAIGAARHRVIVASPLVTNDGVGYDVLKQLEEAMGRGVRVTLLLPPRTKGDLGEAEARRRLTDLASRRSKFKVLDCETADSIVVSDGRCVVGSFPWLGHVGNPERSLINHESVAVFDDQATSEAVAECERRTGVDFGSQ